MLHLGRQKYATTVYHIIQAELSDDMPTMSSIKKKTQTVYIRTQLWGSAREEAVQWVKDLLNITYQDVILTLSL